MLGFGPFELDERAATLSRDSVPVALAASHVRLLAHLAQRQGEAVSREEIVDRLGLPALTPHAVTRVVNEIRKALGDSASDPHYIQTLPRAGYRFVAELRRIRPAVDEAPTADDDRQTLAEWQDKPVAIDAVVPEELSRAIAAFERAVAERPSSGQAHAGLANAYLLRFELTRFSRLPDRDALARAVAAAERACRVEPALADGWSTLGYVLALTGRPEQARAAARKAVEIDPAHRRHLYRLAFAAWGDERLQVVAELAKRAPGYAPARMLSAMVLTARGALVAAEREATEGCEAAVAAGEAETLPGAGLHLMRGLLRSARGEIDEALEQFDAEIDAGPGRHVYGPEHVVQARVAAGFALLIRGAAEAALQRFRAVREQIPDHTRATLGQLVAERRLGDFRRARDTAVELRQSLDDLLKAGRYAEAALVEAGDALARGRTPEAVDLLDRLLTLAPPGPAGWQIAVDPMLAEVRYSAGRSGVLTKLANRAH